MLSHTLLRFVRAGRGDAYATNAWIGPPGTVSPLHRDPTDNLLAQLYGEKRVLLYSERDIDRDSMSGTSSHVLSIYSMLLRTLVAISIAFGRRERHECGPLRALAVASFYVRRCLHSPSFVRQRRECTYRLLSWSFLIVLCLNIRLCPLPPAIP